MGRLAEPVDEANTCLFSVTDLCILLTSIDIIVYPYQHTKHSCQILIFQYMGRLAEPVEVAKTCLYLATDATYSTGQNIYVSGGDELDYGFKSQMGFFFQP